LILVNVKDQQHKNARRFCLNPKMIKWRYDQKGTSCKLKEHKNTRSFCSELNPNMDTRSNHEWTNFASMSGLILHHTRTFTDVKRLYKIFLNKSHKFHKLECWEIYSSIRSISKSLSSNIACNYRFFKELVTKHLLTPEKAGNTIIKYVWSVFINSNKDNDSLIEKENIPTTEKKYKKNN